MRPDMQNAGIPQVIVKVEPDIHETPTGRGLRKRYYTWKLKEMYIPTGKRGMKVTSPACAIPPQLDEQFHKWLDDPFTDRNSQSTAARIQTKEWYRNLLDQTIELKDERRSWRSVSIYVAGDLP